MTFTEPSDIQNLIRRASQPPHEVGLHPTLQIRKLGFRTGGGLAKVRQEDQAQNLNPDLLSPQSMPLLHAASHWAQTNCSLRSIHPSILQITIKSLQYKVPTEEMDKCYLTGSPYMIARYPWRTGVSGSENTLYVSVFLFSIYCPHLKNISSNNLVYPVQCFLPQEPGTVTGTELG